jgi:hypothetical protein
MPQGRPQGQPNTVLSPLELRIAMMRVAGMSYDAIARFLNQASKTIEYHCDKPRVQAHMLQLQSTFVEDLRGPATRMNERLTELAFGAVEVQAQTMQDMNERRQSPGLKQDTQIKAAALAITTAQDILDRAYGKAPKRIEVESHNTHTIDPAGAEMIAAAIREADAVDVTPHNQVRPLDQTDPPDHLVGDHLDPDRR